MRVGRLSDRSARPELTGDPSCGWCGLHVATCIVNATPTCRGCDAGGRVERIKQYQQRLKRAAEGTW